ncbi:MAG: glycosyltransferase family 4 protein, partial [Phycisphaerae bacterium]
MTKFTPKSAELDLLVINQVAGPLMLDLLEELELNGIRSALVTGYMENPHGGKMRFRVISAPELKKAPQWKRLWTWGKFSLRAALAAIRYRRVPMLVVTNPPLTMLLMPWLKRLFGCRYAILQYDIYPDVLVKMGYVGQNSAIARLWRKLSRKAMLQSEAVFTLGNRMAETLQRHFQPGDRSNIVVIPNWADTEFVKPLSKSENPFARKHCLTNKFVVMYSGAFGATHNIESIVQAARRLADDKTVHVVLIGGGTRQAEVEELVRKHPTDNLALLPFQPFEELKHTFPTADCAIVCLDEGYAGLSVPSKTYYALAAGA